MTSYSFLSLNYLENAELFFMRPLDLNVGFISFYSPLFLEIFSNLNSKIRIEMGVGLQVKCLLFLPYFNRNFFVFINLINSFIAINFHENPFCCFQVTSLEWTNTLPMVQLQNICLGRILKFSLESCAMGRLRVSRHVLHLSTVL